jgi:hypothetical protein
VLVGRLTINEEHYSYDYSQKRYDNEYYRQEGLQYPAQEAPWYENVRESDEYDTDYYANTAEGLCFTHFESGIYLF